jgi:hypothetical protein
MSSLFEKLITDTLQYTEESHGTMDFYYPYDSSDNGNAGVAKWLGMQKYYYPKKFEAEIQPIMDREELKLREIYIYEETKDLKESKKNQISKKKIIDAYESDIIIRKKTISELQIKYKTKRQQDKKELRKVIKRRDVLKAKLNYL